MPLDFRIEHRGHPPRAVKVYDNGRIAYCHGEEERLWAALQELIKVHNLTWKEMAAEMDAPAQPGTLLSEALVPFVRRLKQQLRERCNDLEEARQRCESLAEQLRCVKQGAAMDKAQAQKARR